MSNKQMTYRALEFIVKSYAGHNGTLEGMAQDDLVIWAKTHQSEIAKSLIKEYSLAAGFEADGHSEISNQFYKYLEEIMGIFGLRVEYPGLYPIFIDKRERSHFFEEDYKVIVQALNEGLLASVKF